MPRKTDSHNPADWLWIAEAELQGIQQLANQAVSFAMCKSKLAEVVEKIMKAELIRTGWILEKTHDLERLLGLLAVRNNDLADHFEPLCDSLAEVYFSGRYPGFDFEDPNWPSLQTQISTADELLSLVKRRVTSSTAMPGTNETGA